LSSAFPAGVADLLRNGGLLCSERPAGLLRKTQSTKEMAFSESAFFRDFLIVLQKGDAPTKCAFVYLKKKINEISMAEASGIPITVRQLSEGEQYEDDAMFVTWRDQSEVSSHWSDLGHLVAFNTQEGEKLTELYRAFLDTAKEELIVLQQSKQPIIPVIRGFEHGGENLQSFLFIVRALNKKRLTRSNFILKSEEKDTVSVVSKNGSAFKVSRRTLKPGLRTSSYVAQLDIGKCSDYFITKPFDEFNQITQHLGVTELDFAAISTKAQKRFTHLVLSRRFNLTAPGTMALAFYSDEKVLPVGLHWALLSDRESSKALCVWFNSVFYLLELLLQHTETGGSYMLITEEQVKQLHVPNLNKSSMNILLKAFEQVRGVEFPPIFEQFENPPEARKIIDRAALKTIGCNDSETEEILPELYKAMTTELRSLDELMHKSSAKEKEPTPQLHLFAKE
jgi:hypothetical protein